MRALITGGTGYLGRRLGEALAARYSVVLADLTAAEVPGCGFAKLDVTDVADVRRVFAETKPDVVIHAAANKYVDVGDKDPFSSIDVNLVGSQNIARVAMETEVGAVVGISSCAATPPQISVYGLAKAIMERMFCSLDGRTKTRFTSVRLGNIPWSTGSALPVWSKMLAESGVAKTSGPEDRRFLCTAPQATASVLAALDHLDELSGKVLVRKSKQAKMLDLLEPLVAAKGGRIERVEARVAGRSVEGLLGDLEAPYTRAATIDGADYFVISFNDKPAAPVSGGYFATEAEALSAAELRAIVEGGLG